MDVDMAHIAFSASSATDCLSRDALSSSWRSSLSKGIRQKNHKGIHHDREGNQTKQNSEKRTDMGEQYIHDGGEGDEGAHTIEPERRCVGLGAISSHVAHQFNDAGDARFSALLAKHTRAGVDEEDQAGGDLVEEPLRQHATLQGDRHRGILLQQIQRIRGG